MRNWWSASWSPTCCSTHLAVGSYAFLDIPHGIRMEVDDTTNDPPVVMATPGSVLPHGRGMQIVAGIAVAWGVEWRRPRRPRGSSSADGTTSDVEYRIDWLTAQPMG